MYHDSARRAETTAQAARDKRLAARKLAAVQPEVEEYLAAYVAGSLRAAFNRAEDAVAGVCGSLGVHPRCGPARVCCFL